MTSVFNVEITESVEDLKTLVSKQTNARLRDRVRALYLCKTGLAQTRRELAAMLGCNESTLYRWLCSYQSQGLAGLLQVKASPGKPSKLAPEVLNKLRARVAERVGFCSYGEIQSWRFAGVRCECCLPNCAWHRALQTQLEAQTAASSQCRRRPTGASNL